MYWLWNTVQEVSYLHSWKIIDTWVKKKPKSFSFKSWLLSNTYTREISFLETLNQRIFWLMLLETPSLLILVLQNKLEAKRIPTVEVLSIWLLKSYQNSFIPWMLTFTAWELSCTRSWLDVHHFTTQISQTTKPNTTFVTRKFFFPEKSYSVIWLNNWSQNCLSRILINVLVTILGLIKS